MIDVKGRDFKGFRTAKRSNQHGKMAQFYRAPKTPKMSDNALLLLGASCIVLGTWLAVVVICGMLAEIG